MANRGSRANGDHTKSQDEVIAGLRELLDMQAELIAEKDRKIAALERAARNRERADRRRAESA